MAASSRGKVKGRGTASEVDARYLDWQREAFDDGWDPGEATPPPATTVTIEHPRTIISRNQSPDIPFEASINPYKGCEHGCIYCYSRPTHAYMDLSPGIDFETKLFAKPDAASLLRKELAQPGYRCTPIALGANTDPYQPIEKDWGITRSIIEVLHAQDHPLTIVTKSWRVERDIDLLADMARKNLVQVFVSITSLDHELARRLEPRAAAPRRRVECVRNLSQAGIPVGVLFAPVIPFLNDDALEEVLAAAADAGVGYAGYVIVRLPLEIRDLFVQWLEQHAPLKAERVMNTIRDLRGGRDNDPRFFSRQRGSGAFAEIIRGRFELACRRHRLNRGRLELRTELFHPPRPDRKQLDLF